MASLPIRSLSDTLRIISLVVCDVELVVAWWRVAAVIVDGLLLLLPLLLLDVCETTPFLANGAPFVFACDEDLLLRHVDCFVALPFSSPLSGASPPPPPPPPPLECSWRWWWCDEPMPLVVASLLLLMWWLWLWL